MAVPRSKPGNGVVLSAAPAPTTGTPAAGGDANRRKDPRASLLTQIEAQAEKLCLLGRARDISVGGILIESPDTLAEGVAVVVRFFLPPERTPIEAPGRVVRCEAGKCMGIAFLTLPESQRKAVLEYVHSIQGAGTAEPPAPETSIKQRRSGRIRRRVTVQLDWHDEQGRRQQETVETQLLSRHGALVLTFTPVALGQLVRVRQIDTNREANARVVAAKASEHAGRTEVAFELLDVEEFWGMEFPPPEANGSPSSLRRSERIPQQLDLRVNWEDEYGRAREEAAVTQNLSRHGARLRVATPLTPGQRLRVFTADNTRQAAARVIWAQPVPTNGADLGIEFLDIENFWGLPQLNAANGG